MQSLEVMIATALHTLLNGWKFLTVTLTGFKPIQIKNLFLSMWNMKSYTLQMSITYQNVHYTDVYILVKETEKLEVTGKPAIRVFIWWN